MNTSPPPPSRLLQLPLRNKSPKRFRNAKNLSLNVPSFAQLSVAASSLSTPKTATAATFSLNSVPSAGLPTSVPSYKRKPNSSRIHSSISKTSSSLAHQLHSNDANMASSMTSSHPILNKDNHQSSTHHSKGYNNSSSSLSLSSSSTISCIPKQTQNLSLVIPFQNNQQDTTDSYSNTSATTSATLSPSSTYSSSTAIDNNNNSSSYITERVVVVNTLPLSDPNDFAESTFAAYPNGPVLICPPNIYLYSEPTKEEASQFDVILNVAKEVKNPFQTSSSSSIPDFISASQPNSTINRDYDSLSTHSSISSFSSSSCSSYSTNLSSLSPTSSPDATLFPETRHETFPNIESAIKNNDWINSKDLYPSSSLSSSSTSSSPQPEYIYVPWDHNSPIAQDLTSLTELIEDRSKRSNKKVLVHCQCGVSRSASLIVAYVMKSKNWGVHQAYQWVKDKSPGISPNMSLIYQLVDWARLLEEKEKSSIIDNLGNANISFNNNINNMTNSNILNNNNFSSNGFLSGFGARSILNLDSSSRLCADSNDDDLAGLNRHFGR